MGNKKGNPDSSPFLLIGIIILLCLAFIGVVNLTGNSLVDLGEYGKYSVTTLIENRQCININTERTWFGHYNYCTNYVGPPFVMDKLNARLTHINSQIVKLESKPFCDITTTDIRKIIDGPSIECHEECTEDCGACSYFNEWGEKRTAGNLRMTRKECDKYIRKDYGERLDNFAVLEEGGCKEVCEEVDHQIHCSVTLQDIKNREQEINDTRAELNRIQGYIDTVNLAVN